MCYQVAGERLIDAINSDPRGKLTRVRRALFWYSILPQLLLSDSGRRRNAATKEVLRRCSLFLSGGVSELLRDLEEAHDNFAARGRRKPKPESAEKRTRDASKMIQSRIPHSISRATNLMLGHGRASIDDPETLQQMKDKHPPGRGRFDPFPPPSDDSDSPDLSLTPRLVRQIDPMVGTGPRGLKGSHLLALHDAEIHLKDSTTGTPLDTLQKLGEAALSGEVPWIVAAICEGLLTPLRKKPTGNDARPVVAEGVDSSTWSKACAKSLAPAVRDQVSPQQLAVAVPAAKKS